MLDKTNKPISCDGLGRIGAIQSMLATVGCGGAPLGNLNRAISDTAARDAVDAAWHAGTRYFDTAPLYGRGLSEQRLGAALSSRPRDAFLLSTKVGRLLEPSPDGVADASPYVDVAPYEVRRDYTRDGVLRSVEDSLGRLGLDRIDIIYVHDLEPAAFSSLADYDHHVRALLDNGWRALDDLRSAGTIAAVGLGMNQVAACGRLVAAIDPDLVLLAGRYTLLDRSGDDLIDDCAARGIGVIAAGIFNSGILAPGAHPTFDYAPASAAIRDRAARMQALCDEANVPLAAAAITFVRRDPRIAGLLIGAQTACEIVENAALAATDVPQSLLDALLAC